MRAALFQCILIDTQFLSLEHVRSALAHSSPAECIHARVNQATTANLGVLFLF